MGVQGMPIGRRDSSDIIAGVDFLSVFMRNAEERYYPIEKSPQPYDILDNIYEYDYTTRRPRFSISTRPTTTTEPTTTTTTTRKPKLIIPTLPTIRRVEQPTSEASSNIELRTAPPPITKQDVYKYIRRKSNVKNQEGVKEINFKTPPVEIKEESAKDIELINSNKDDTSNNQNNIKVETIIEFQDSNNEELVKNQDNKTEESSKEIEYRKEDTFTEVSIEVRTEQNIANSPNAISIIEPSAIISHSNTAELIIDEEDPLTIEATELNEEIVARPVDPNPEQKRYNRNDESSYQYEFSSRLSPNKARSISYSAVIQVPAETNWKDNQQDVLQERKNHTESVAETNDYYVTSKYSPQRKENSNLDQQRGETWNQKAYEEQQHNLYHTTEKNWGTSEKIWGMQQTTPKVWGVQQTTPKVWGVQQTTPRVWGVQQTTPKVWGVQQTTPKVWGSTEKNWGVQQTTPKVWGVQQQPYVEPKQKMWGTTEKNWGMQENYNGYAQQEQNYEVDESDSVLNDGRAHGVQEPDKPLQIKVGNAPTNANDNQKVGYVVEGRNYKKYRVEERTSDGFIVGEYGVVSNNDGSLRGVRYTADGTINPSVIYDALMKFLSL